MMSSDDDTQAALRAISVVRARQAPQHVDAQGLFDYVRDELFGGRADEVREHLAVCAECTRTVLDLTDFPDIAACGERDPDQADAEHVWRRLQHEIGALQNSNAPSAMEPWWRALARLSLPPRRLALAAWLLVGGVVGFGGARLLPVESGFQAAVISADLAPGSTATRQDPNDRRRVIALPGSEYVKLLLTLPVLPAQASERVRVEVADERGGVLWSSELSQVDQARTLLLELPVRRLPVGCCRIRLRLAGETAKGVFAEYAARIERY